MLADFSVALLLFRLLGRDGLILLIAANVILCNLQVMKLTTLFGVTVTLGNILYGSIFFATDMLSEIYGKRQARRGVMIGFVALLMFTGVTQIALLFSVAPDPWAEAIQSAMSTLFGLVPRIALASVVAYLVSQFHDVWAFHYWKARTRGRHLWLRNNFSTAVSQLIDTAIFCTVAFYGVVGTQPFIEILISTYVMKLAVAMMDTPFMYLGRRIALARGELIERGETNA
ncbi:queuosine precursor transporter [Candidatus Fermentibacterales bacterium]|nr:queuosine precursor transporter [Candidatus Fermentibacterales bacterium]